MKYKIPFLLIFLYLLSQTTPAQWRIAGAKGDFLFNVTRIDSVLFVGADRGIYVGSGVNNLVKLNSEILQTQNFRKYADDILAVANNGLFKWISPNNRWEKLNIGDLTPACLLTLTDVWLCGTTCNGIYKSTDNGINWTHIADSLSCVASLLKVDDKIFAISAEGLHVSNDKGSTWRNIDTLIRGYYSSSNTLLQVGDTLYAGGTGGLFKSLDNGETWNPIGDFNYVTDIFLNNNKLFIIASSEMFFSNDFGSTWLHVSEEGYESGWSFQPMCMTALRENLFLATTRGLYYMHLADFDRPRMELTPAGEINLGKITVGEKKDTSICIENRGYKELLISDISCNSDEVKFNLIKNVIGISEGIGFYITVYPKHAGDFEAVLSIKSNDSDIPRKITLNLTVSPIEYILYENYPNPFNSSTIIDYQIATMEHVNLTIYNTLGKEIKTLVNELMNPGKHSVPFQAENLASGIYLTRLQTEHFVSVKKMVLIK